MVLENLISGNSQWYFPNGHSSGLDAGGPDGTCRFYRDPTHGMSNKTLSVTLTVRSIN